MITLAENLYNRLAVDVEEKHQRSSRRGTRSMFTSSVCVSIHQSVFSTIKKPQRLHEDIRYWKSEIHYIQGFNTEISAITTRISIHNSE